MYTFLEAIHLALYADWGRQGREWCSIGEHQETKRSWLSFFKDSFGNSWVSDAARLLDRHSRERLALERQLSTCRKTLTSVVITRPVSAKCLVQSATPSPLSFPPPPACMLIFEQQDVFFTARLQRDFDLLTLLLTPKALLTRKWLTTWLTLGYIP